MLRSYPHSDPGILYYLNSSDAVVYNRLPDDKNAYFDSLTELTLPLISVCIL
jgi:hypothetical protein